MKKLNVVVMFNVVSLAIFITFDLLSYSLLSSSLPSSRQGNTTRGTRDARHVVCTVQVARVSMAEFLRATLLNKMVMTIR